MYMKKELPKFPTDNLMGDTFRHKFSYENNYGETVDIGVSLKASVYGNKEELDRIEEMLKENSEQHRAKRAAFDTLSEADQLRHHLKKLFDEVREAIKLCQPNVRSWDSQKSVEEELRDLRELRSKVFCKLDFALSDIPNYAVDRGYYSK